MRRIAGSCIVLIHELWEHKVRLQLDLPTLHVHYLLVKPIIDVHELLAGKLGSRWDFHQLGKPPLVVY